MPRKLPWATGKDVKIKDPKPSAVLRRRREPSVSASDDQIAPKIELHQTSSPVKPVNVSANARTRRVKRELSRTPSTSPPPAPPQIEHMLEGYDADDVYLMVEDEFQAVAQSFTQHLHHAEYVRLKKKARDAPPTQPPMPTDKMRAETRKRLESRLLRDKQNGAVKGMTRSAVSASLQLDDEEDEEGDDPWTGTSLAGLMTTTQSQKRTALVGLEKIPSSTRAAKGFSRGERRTTEKPSLIEIFGGSRKNIGGNDSSEVVNLSEDDDLDPLPKVPERNANTARRGGRTENLHSETRKISPSALDGGQRPRNRANPGSTSGKNDLANRSAKSVSTTVGRRAIDIIDDSDDANDLPRRSVTVAPGGSTLNGSKSAKDKDKHRKARGHEIPTFLV